MPPPPLLLLDFDGTITQADTLNSLVTLSIPLSSSPNPDKDHKDKLPARWESIVTDYVAAHARHVESYSPVADLRKTVEDELTFLESLGVVERRSVRAVSEAGFFRGLDGEGLEGVGREAVEKGVVKVRRGFGEFMRRVLDGEGKGEVAVVSVNWSGEFIKGVVGAGDGGDWGEGKVVANAVGFPEGEVKGPGELGGEVLATAGDKLRAMKSVVEGGEGRRVVYFGDSTTDLACLVEADLGVVMADDGESKLLRTFRRVGLEVPHVGESQNGSQLVWAKDFDEVLQSRVMDWI